VEDFRYEMNCDGWRYKQEVSYYKSSATPFAGYNNIQTIGYKIQTILIGSILPDVPELQGA
jgi:hypothetical protein